jgi:hypothetical protein
MLGPTTVKALDGAKLTAIDIKQMAHSEVCVDALSPSGLPLARFRSLWCVCLLQPLAHGFGLNQK